MSNSYFVQLHEKVSALLSDQSENDWLKQQSWRSIANFSHEEVYELIDAIEKGDMSSVKDELADWCFHLLIYAEMGKRDQYFTLEDIAERALNKIDERHSDDKVTSEEAHVYWQKEKYREKYQRSGSILGDVPSALPALLKANKILDAVKQVGFTFDGMTQARIKVGEELMELDQAILEGGSAEIFNELGDVLFACVALANKAGINPEEALRATSRRFVQRINRMEQLVDARQLDFFALEKDELLRLYEESKRGKK